MIETSFISNAELNTLIEGIRMAFDLSGKNRNEFVRKALCTFLAGAFLDPFDQKTADQLNYRIEGAVRILIEGANRGTIEVSPKALLMDRVIHTISGSSVPPDSWAEVLLRVLCILADRKFTPQPLRGDEAVHDRFVAEMQEHSDRFFRKMAEAS